MRTQINYRTLFPCVVLLTLSAFANETNSILKQVASSPEFAHKLITEYESSTNGFTDDRLLAVGIAYIVEDRFDEARPIYERFLRDHPNHTRALRGFGTVNMNQKRYEDAIKCYKQAWSQGDVDSLAELGVAYAKLGRLNELKGLLPDLLKHKTEDSDIAASLLAYALSKDPPDEPLLLEAVDALSEKDFLVRDDITHLIGLATARLKTDEVNNATLRVILRKIIRSYAAAPNSFPKRRLSMVGDAYLFLSDYSEAETIYNKVLKDEPENQIALRGLGAVKMYQHRPKEAIENLRKAWKHREPEALSNLGSAYVMARDFEGMKDVIPDLLEKKLEDLQNLTTLLAYCLNVDPPDKEVFKKTIEGVTDDRFLRRADTTDLAILAFKKFGDEERSRRLFRLKAEQNKGFRG